MLTEGLNFTKMHSSGNDFAFISSEKLPSKKDPLVNAMIKKICHRHTGIGADGLVFVQTKTPTQAPPFLIMRYFNADGSFSPLCVNALICTASYYKKKYSNLNKFYIKSPLGNHQVASQKTNFNISIQKPILSPNDIPVKLPEGKNIFQIPVKIKDKIYNGTAISMGNPHLIIEVAEITKFLDPQIGKELTYHAWFPEQVNVTFVQIDKKNKLQVITFERGVGRTLSCGSAACATVVALKLQKKCTTESIDVHAAGGTSEISWSNEDSPVYVKGKGHIIYEGIWLNENISKIKG